MAYSTLSDQGIGSLRFPFRSGAISHRLLRAGSGASSADEAAGGVLVRDA
jgi:hypothetical protein